MFGIFGFLYNKDQYNKVKYIDFLKLWPISLFVSLLMITSFLGFYFYFKINNPDERTFNYSVDFTGGIQLYLKLSKHTGINEIVSVLEKGGLSGSTIREFENNELLVRIKKDSLDVSKEANKVKDLIEINIPDTKVDILQIDSVGSAVGSSLRIKSIYAIVAILILISLYIALRFLSFTYAISAIISLFHDAFVILTIFLIFQKEISINVIQAILAVLGYSINDTIVIFARIRENLKLLKDHSFYDVINISITETLSRTILTTLSTLLAVLSVYILGGEVLRDLSFPLLIGILFGIYSTIFIATPDRKSVV